MKKRLAIMIPLAAVVAAVMVYLLADRPWLVTNVPNTYDIRADAPVSIIFDQFDKTRGVYRILNRGSESAVCTNRFVTSACGFPNTSSTLPDSTTFPFSMTATLLQIICTTCI